MTTKFYGRRSKKGMTGLETAIILIAFIIVASTFAFTILNLGFQTAQKSGQVVQNGLNQASSSLQLDGAVVAYQNASATTKASYIQFEVQLTAGSSPVDLSVGKLTVSYQSASVYVANAYTSNSNKTLGGVVIAPITGSGSVIQPGNTFQVTVYLNGTSHTGTSPIIASSNQLAAYGQFTIELKPTVGSVLMVTRTLPATITQVIDLN